MNPRTRTTTTTSPRPPAHRPTKPMSVARLALIAALAGVLGPVTVAAAPAIVAAQRGGGMGMGAFRSEAQRLWMQLDQRYDEFAETLSLTEAQAGLLDIVVADFRDTNEDALERLAAMMTEMRGLMGGGRPDRGAFAGIAEKHGNPAMELAPAFEALKADVADLLDPQQVQRMNRLLARPPTRPPPGWR